VRSVHLQKLCSDFEKLHVLKLKNISKYFAIVLAIYNQIKRYEEKMKEIRVVEKILRSLQKKFYYMVIKKSQNIDVLSIQGLIGKLQVYEERVNEIQKDMDARALFSKQDGSGYLQGCRGRGQNKERRGRGRFERGGCDNLNRSTS